MRGLKWLAAVWLLWSAGVAQAQFKETAPAKGPKLGTPVSQKLKVGVIVQAEGGSVGGLVATVPVPSDWPEQTVKIVNEELSPTVQNLRYRTSAGQLKQMMIEVPQLPAGQEARAIITFEVSHAPQLPPEDTSLYKIPKNLDRRLIVYTGASPLIESRHNKVTALSKQLTADKDSAWAQVEAIYDWVHTNVQLKEGELKGAARTMLEKNGSSEDITCLFIALCRAAKIPARTVWVPQHCYPEFYLVDDAGQGQWFPCQSSSRKPLGSIDEVRPILLKGDNFKDPERPREKLRFVPEFVKGSGSKSQGRPKIDFIRETVGG